MHLVGVLVRDDRHQAAHGQLGVVQPRVLLAPPPHDHRQRPTGRQGAADVAQRGAGRHEEHRAEAGEREVVGAAQVVGLNVGDEEVSVGHAGGAGFGARGLDEVRRAVDPDRAAPLADAARDEARAVAEAAADVEHARAFRVGRPRQRFVAVRRETVDQKMLEAAELVEEDRVPRLDDDVVLSRHADASAQLPVCIIGFGSRRTHGRGTPARQRASACANPLITSALQRSIRKAPMIGAMMNARTE